MSTVKNRDDAYFDEEIKVRDLIRAQYHTWPEPRNGLVISLTEDTLTAIFLPAIHQSVCYFTVKADEVKDGKWKIRLISFDDAWEMTVRSDDFADEYDPAPTEDGSDSSAADE